MKRLLTSLPALMLLRAPHAAAEEPLTTHLRTGIVWQDDQTGDDERSEFTLARTEMGASWASGAWNATAIGEWVRSAAPGSLMGVAGNSYLLRPREMEVGWHQTLNDAWLVSGSGGLLLLAPTRMAAPDPLSAFEGTPEQRFLGDDAADLGVEVRVAYEAFVTVTAALHNGEGGSDVERNRGKTGAASILLRPGGEAGLEGFRPSLEGYLSEGTLGSGSQQVTRAGGVVAVRHAFGTVRVGYGVGEGSRLLGATTSNWMRATVETAPIYAGLSLLGLHERYSPDDGVGGVATRSGMGLRWQGGARLLTTATAWFELAGSDPEVAAIPGAASATEGARLILGFTLLGQNEEQLPQ